jgi:hypothetical protein
MTPSGALADSLWQLVVSTYRPEFAARLAAQPSSADVTLPNFILPLLPLGAGVTPLSRTLRRAFCLFTLAAIIALCASAWNNRQLLQRVGSIFSITRRLRWMTTPKARAVQILRGDALQLDRWARHGEPLEMGLGLYHGEHLRMPVLDAIRSYVPPPPPLKPAEKTAPKIIRLDSMSLFDTGRWALKPGSTKLLVNSLVGIKAKPAG